MGAIAWAVVAGVVAGISAAAPWVIYAQRVVPSLARAPARPAAYVVAAIPAVVASVATIARLVDFTTGSLRADIVLIAAAIGIACSWGPIVHGALYLTGGPRALRGTTLAIETEVDDMEPAPEGARIVGFTLGAGLFLATAMWFVLPESMAVGNACGDAERILANADPPPANTAPMADALPYNPPEDGAQYVMSFPMNLDQTAESRHDPETREQLLEAGFVGAHVRSWMAADGRWIQADVMEFDTAEGAAGYQAQVNLHACTFANEAFEAPMGGIGLQVRYGTGDPIVEQVSWVAGNRRYLVQVSALEAPSDHGRILGILDAATATWPPS